MNNFKHFMSLKEQELQRLQIDYIRYQQAEQIVFRDLIYDQYAIWHFEAGISSKCRP